MITCNAVQQPEQISCVVQGLTFFIKCAIYQKKWRIIGQGKANLSSNTKKKTITHLDSSLGEAESLLDNRRQLPDTTPLLAKDILGPGGENDNLCACRRHANLNATVAIFGQLPSEELVQLGLEDSIGYKL